MEKSTEPVELLTPGVIARRSGIPLHRIQHTIDTRGVEPAGRAGTLRVFSEAQAAEIIEIARSIERPGRGRRAS